MFLFPRTVVRVLANWVLPSCACPTYLPRYTCPNRYVKFYNESHCFRYSFIYCERQDQHPCSWSFSWARLPFTIFQLKVTYAPLLSFGTNTNTNTDPTCTKPYCSRSALIWLPGSRSRRFQCGSRFSFLPKCGSGSRKPNQCGSVSWSEDFCKCAVLRILIQDPGHCCQIPSRLLGQSSRKN